jgi:hypothetical protein
MTATDATRSASGPVRGHSRLRRWLIVLLTVAALLALYGVALRWASEELGQGVLESVRDVPVLDDDHHKPRSH